MSYRFTTPVWGSFAQYLEAKRWRLNTCESVTVGESGLNLIRTRLDHAFTDEATPDLVLQYFSRGHCRFSRCDMGFGRTKAVHGRGQWVVVPPNCTFELEGTGDFELIIASVPFQHISKDLDRISGKPIRDFGRLHAGFSNHEPFISAAMRQLWNDHRESELYAESLMTMVLRRLMELAGYQGVLDGRSGRLSDSQMSRALEYLHAHAETQATCLSELADEAELSRFQFIRRFKASTGSTPHEYLVRLRVELGKQRLRSGQSAVMAATGSGFYDQAHFSRQFKKAYGIPPGRYQRELRS